MRRLKPWCRSSTTGQPSLSARASPRVFIDNYAAIPPESIRRLLALHRAGILRILTLGEDYELQRGA